MSAYYNEIDRFNCDWLSNLMDANLITPGKIDDRSIVDVRSDDLAGFERVHFFAGIGGWDHSLNLAGWSGPVWTGSCPCQPFSVAGARKGFDDERHLWPVWRDLIAQRGPAIVFGEQVASASDWLRLVRGDLEALGYAVGAMPVQAASAGADHLRDRFWFVADADYARSQRRRVLPERARERAAGADGLADCDSQHQRRRPGEEGGAQICCEREVEGPERQRNGVLDRGARESDYSWVVGADGKSRRVKPGVRLLVDGFPNRVGILRGFGNAIDPRPAAAFIGAFMTASQLSSHHHSTGE